MKLESIEENFTLKGDFTEKKPLEGMFNSTSKHWKVIVQNSYFWLIEPNYFPMISRRIPKQSQIYNDSWKVCRFLEN